MKTGITYSAVLFRHIRHAMLVFLVACVAIVPATSYAQEGVSQLTLPNGQIVSWGEPWGGAKIDGNRSVYLGSPQATSFYVEMFSASESTAEQAGRPTNDSWNEIQAGSDNAGGFYFLGGQKAIDLSGNEVNWVVFRRATPTPDGQWILVTQLDGFLENLENDLELVPLTISIDMSSVWDDIDPPALTSFFLEWAGVPAAGNQPASESQADTGADSLPRAAVGSVNLDNGTTVEWTDFWSPNDEFSTTFSITLQSVGLQFFIQDYRHDMPLEETWATTRAAFGQDAVLIEEGRSPDGGYYGLWVASLSDGTVVNVMARASYAPGTTTPTSTGFYAMDYLTEPMVAAMPHILINGTHAWKDVDGQALLRVFQAGAPTGESLFISTGAAAQQAPAQAEDVDEPTSDDGLAATSADDENEPVSRSAGRDDDRSSTSSANNQTGLIDDTTYQSDMYGYTVEWDDTWSVSDDGIVIDEENGYDSLTLFTEDAGVGAINLWSYDGGDLTIEDVIDFWVSDDYLDEFQPADTEVLLADSSSQFGAVVLVGPYSDDDPELWVTVLEVTFIDDSIALETTLVAPVNTFEDVYEDALQAVSVDGAEVIGFFTVDEITDELP